MVDFILRLDIGLARLRVLFFVTVTTDDFRRVMCVCNNAVLVFINTASRDTVEGFAYVHRL